MDHKILVIIVAYNQMKWIERCYNSLRSSTVHADIIVIDNGSTDGTQNYIKKHFPEVELVQSSENLGFGRANNIGIRKAITEWYNYIYLLNQDAWIQSNTFANLIKVSKSNLDYGILSPMQMQDNEINMEDRFLSKTIRTFQSYSPYLEDDLLNDCVRPLYQVESVMAAHWLVTRSCFTKVGCFSPTFPHYGEDNNYIKRAKYWGFKVGIVPSAKAIHDRSDKYWSKEKELYVNGYITSLGVLSDPMLSVSIFSIIKGLLVYSFKQKSTLPLKYAYTIFKNKSTILKNKKISKEECSFVSYE